MIIIKIYAFAIIAIIMLLVLKPVLCVVAEDIYLRIKASKQMPLPDSTYNFKVQSDFSLEKGRVFYYLMWSKDNKTWHKDNDRFEKLEDAKKRINDFCQRNHTVWAHVANAPQLDSHKEN